MTDWKYVLRRLLRRGKVYAAAILDHSGNPIISIPEMKISAPEGEGLIRAVGCAYDCTFTLPLNGTRFTCFHKAKSPVLMGLTDELMFVATIVDQGVFTVGLARTDSPGSCIYEMEEFARIVRKKHYQTSSSKAALLMPS